VKSSIFALHFRKAARANLKSSNLLSMPKPSRQALISLMPLKRTCFLIPAGDIRKTIQHDGQTAGKDLIY